MCGTFRPNLFGETPNQPLSAPLWQQGKHLITSGSDSVTLDTPPQRREFVLKPSDSLNFLVLNRYYLTRFVSMYSNGVRCSLFAPWMARGSVLQRIGEAL